MIAANDAQTKRAFPLQFNAAQDGLILADGKQDYLGESEFIFTPFASDADSHYSQETYNGPHITIALVKDSRRRDREIIARIYC